MGFLEGDTRNLDHGSHGLNSRGLQLRVEVDSNPGPSDSKSQIQNPQSVSPTDLLCHQQVTLGMFFHVCHSTKSKIGKNGV